MPHGGKVAGIALLLAALAGTALAQAPPGPLPPGPGGAPQAPKKEPAPIRVKVELVNTPVTVRDAAGEPVLDLRKEEFRVFDDGVEQQIEHFDLGGDPLSVVILLETSSRVEALLPAVRKTGSLFTQVVLGQVGDAAIVGYDDSIAELLPFTGDQDEIEKTIAHLPLGTSGARLQDALSRAIDMLRKRPPDRRRVILVVGEAADTGSETKLGEAIREAQLNNVTIYTVGLSTTLAQLRAEPRYSGMPSATPPGTFGRPGIPGQPQTPTTEEQRNAGLDLLSAIIWLVQCAENAVGRNSLELASAGTGGAHVSTFRESSIEKALDQIGGELHAQYTLAYRPSGSHHYGFHKIEVQVSRPGVRVRTRPGYYLGAPEG
jgi:VWFA-related protein